MMKIFFIGFFGILGVYSRYFLDVKVSQVWNQSFPLGTFVINLTGAFLIGLVYAMAVEKSLVSPDCRAGIMVGFIGGYTTFSTYCMETSRLLHFNMYRQALMYFILSPVLGLALTAAGLFTGRFFFS